MRAITDMRTSIISIVVILALATGAYFFTSRDTYPASVTSSISTANWKEYDGNNWSIKYPPSLTIEVKQIPNLPRIVTFKGLHPNSFIGVNVSSLDDTNSVMAPLIHQRDPNHADTLGTVLDIQRDSLAQGTSIKDAQKVSIGNSIAARFIDVDTSDPKMPSFNEFVTFTDNTYLAGFTFVTDNSQQPDPEDMATFNTMLLTFRFK